MKTRRSVKALATHRGIARRTLGSERGVSLVVVIMLMVIILAMTGAGLLFSSIDLRVSGNYRAGTQAFFAADTGVNDGFARLGIDPSTSTAAFGPITMSGGLTYCSGSLPATQNNNCATPQPSTVTSINAPGYSLGQGTGYNASGYQFYQYKVNVTGLGTLSSAREVEAQIQYGPVPK
jgi:Tfp pilus assembly protein PilX